ncbi:peptidoglycan-binding protein [Streptomyces sp. NPDC005209]|uniref:peptidoglycan-binding protein n=1 Tax=Streptomyces sp. NPDC005209 TaxID=3156715 RepID=UPI00339F00C3
MDTTTLYYTVRTGDTLSKIAARIHVTLAQLLEWNPEITDPNIIHLGQRIRVSPPEGVPVPDQEFEPFPGADFFQPATVSPIIEVMGYRLIDEGCSVYPGDPDAQWSEADRASYAKWQRKLGFSGADADGIPGKNTWDKLHVPVVFE